jgi:hypothetical protein
LPWLPEFIIRRSKGHFLRFLWKLWSPNFNDEKHVAHIIATQLQKRVVENTLAYYRAAIQTSYRDPKLKSVFARLDNIISTPTKVLCGSVDIRK